MTTVNVEVIKQWCIENEPDIFWENLDKNKKKSIREKVKRRLDPAWKDATNKKSRERLKYRLNNEPGYRERYNKQKNDRINKYLEKNLKILNRLMNGDYNEPLKNRNEKPFKLTPEMGNMVAAKSYVPSMHHIRYDTGGSLGKDIDPNQVLRLANIPKSKLIELMGCIPLHSSDHDWVHRQRVNNKNGYLRDWKRHQWPWCLRSRENFYEILKEFELGNLDYDYFIQTLGGDSED